VKSFDRLKAVVLAIIFTVGVVTMSQIPGEARDASGAEGSGADKPSWIEGANKKLKGELVDKHGEEQRARARRGLEQVSSLWRVEDGDAAVYEAFVLDNFAGDEATLDETFERFERNLEILSGHMHEILLVFRERSDLDIGRIYPFDDVFAAYAPSAHVDDDFFKNKLAFVVLLNFPLTTLDERLAAGASWSRRQWAEARLAQGFSRRVPAEVNQAIGRANALADRYIAEYNIWMYHLINDQGERMFPSGMRLLSHWNLRDEIKAQYQVEEGALERQRTIQKVMERIVTQTIPAVVVDNPYVDWNPYTNDVSKATSSDTDARPPADLEITNAPEPDTRYEVLLATFNAARMVDPYSPAAPTHIARRFDENRELPEERVEAMFEQMLTSPLSRQTGELISKRLGRPLEPFDIWYNGFRPQGRYTAAELDVICKERYPGPGAYEADIPRLLVELDFPQDRADYLAANIVVDPARGSGHAWGAEMRTEKSHLRTRIGIDGMDYKGLNIAVHEMGHNVEQVLTLNDMDHWLLRGVPNTAFTEALAFVFQARDLELLGLASADEKTEALRTLDDYWGACEIAAVALVDMAVWHWMYDHPDATPAQLKEATIGISKSIWNKYYAPVFGQKDVVLLGVYSHMIHSWLYLPDYPIGHLIAFQIEEQMKKAGKIGPEFERMVAMGNVAPDLWMENATGSPVGADALLGATERALKTVSE
jgi:hypothetical protein